MGSGACGTLLDGFPLTVPLIVILSRFDLVPLFLELDSTIGLPEKRGGVFF